MGLGHGNTPTWFNQTDSGRTWASANRVVQSGLVLNLDAGVSASYPVPSGLGYQDVVGVGNTPANLFDRSVTSFTASGANQSLTWTGNINLGSGKYYAIVIAWGGSGQGPINGVTLTVDGVSYTTNYSTLRNTNTDIIGQTIGQGGTASASTRRSDLTPLGSGSLTSVFLSATGGNFSNYFYAIVFVPDSVSDTDFANHVVVNNNFVPTTWTDLSNNGFVSVATGALPIYNTSDNYGFVKDTGTRTDANASSLVLAIPMDGANDGGTTFIDESANIKGSGSAKEITRNGDTKTLRAQSKFYGSSGYFDGTGDYLSLASSADFVQTGNFTMECWIYPTSVSGVNVVLDGRGGSSSKLGPVLYLNGTNFVFDNGAAAVVTATGVMSVNTWYHIAGVRSGNTWTLYINGSSAGTATDTSTYSTNTGFWIGNSFANEAYDGYIQDVRVYKGLAKYTANFTPPRNPNTGTLTNGPIYSGANGGAIVLDGTNDKVVVPYTSSLNPSNLTLSSWFKRTSAGVYSHPANLPIANGTWGPPYTTYGLEFTASTDEIAFTLSFTDNNLSYTTAPASVALAVGSWVNVVGTYDGSFRKIYVNGQLITSVAETRTILTTSADFILGAENRDQNSYMLNGSIAQTLLYNRALSAAEISQNFNALRGRYGI